MKSVPEGYSITFQPRKQGTPKWETFLIPKKPDGASGPDYYSIMSAYIEAINIEIVPSDDGWIGAISEAFGSRYAGEGVGGTIGRSFLVPRQLSRWKWGRVTAKPSACGYKRLPP